jgi:hypothetical protein
MKAPSMLSDADIDLPLPLPMPTNTVGIIYTQDNGAQFSILRHWVKLGHIETKIFELVYSTRSLQLTDAKKRSCVAFVQSMLTHWYEQVPAPFRMDTVATSVDKRNLISMTKMYHAYLHCHISIHGVWSDQAKWVQMVSSLSRAAIHDIAMAVQGPKVNTCIQQQSPPSDDGWNRCVVLSRAMMNLLKATPLTYNLIW